MSNASPDVAALFKVLQQRELQISAMTFDKASNEDPLQARIVFGASVHHIPEGLPESVITLGKVVPVTYHKFGPR